MQIPILIEPVAGNGYRARGAEPFALSADGATREEALSKLREQLQARMESGATIVPLDVPAEEHPLVKYAGMFENNPCSMSGKPRWPSIAGRSTKTRTSHDSVCPRHRYVEPAAAPASGRVRARVAAQN